MSRINTSAVSEIFSKQPKIFKYWLSLSFVFGIALVFIIPPFQSPDEFNHFYRIYQITDGHLVGQFNADSSQLGGYVPKSLVSISKPFDEPLVYKNDVRVSIDTVKKYGEVPLRRNDTMFVPFPNTARYASTAYLSQILTFSYLKLFDAKPMTLMYVGRFATFLTWLFLVAAAVCLTPILKELLMIFLFLPASLAINSTLNADVFTNALVFLVFAFFLRFRYTEKINTKELYFFSALILLITLNKIVYFPILFLFLLIPTKNFITPKFKFYFILLNVLLNITVIFFWSREVNSLIYPDANNLYRTTYLNIHLGGFVVNPALQTKLILQAPISFGVQLLKQSLIIFTGRTPSSWIGSFGWDGYMPSGLGLSLLYTIILWAAIQNYFFKIWERVFLFVLGFVMMLLFILSQHLHWDAVGEKFDAGYVGKYFIPIFPFYFWSVTGVLVNLGFYKNLKSILNWIVILLFIFEYIDFWILICQRYYF